jgi:hypothetical protein
VSDIPVPVDEKSTMAYRVAKLSVIVLTALIILSVIGLVVGLTWKLSGRGSRAAEADAAVFTLPPGATVISSDVQSGRLILHLKTARGDEIDIVSLEDGHLVARIAAAPAR